MIETPMFDGDAVYLAAVDPDADAKQVAAWSHDLDIACRLADGHPRPLTAFEVKKRLEEMIKESEDTGNAVLFAVRMRAGDRLAGLVRLFSINWSHAAANVDVIVGEAADRACAGTEALSLALGYAFSELNLYRLAAHVPEYDFDEIDRLEASGFALEVRRREAIFKLDRCWDLLHYGILRSEWERKNMEAQK